MPLLLAQARARLQLSARGVHRVLRVARTIADLDESAASLTPAHLAEALQLRRAIKSVNGKKKRGPRI